MVVIVIVVLSWSFFWSALPSSAPQGQHGLSSGGRQVVWGHRLGMKCPLTYGTHPHLHCCRGELSPTGSVTPHCTPCFFLARGPTLLVYVRMSMCPNKGVKESDFLFCQNFLMHWVEGGGGIMEWESFSESEHHPINATATIKRTFSSFFRL